MFLSERSDIRLHGDSLFDLTHDARRPEAPTLGAMSVAKESLIGVVGDLGRCANHFRSTATSEQKQLADIGSAA